MIPEQGTFTDRCKQKLDEIWSNVARTAGGSDDIRPYLEDDRLRDAIRRSVNSKTKTYRYVLPTQLLAKVVDPSLDSRSLQLARGGPGAFDARSVCQKVIVPFDKANHNVLGGSAEPYANNPVRIPEVSINHRPQQKDKQGWDGLYLVLNEVEHRQDPTFTEAVLHQTLADIALRLQEIVISYPVPRRISYEDACQLIESYLSEPSGGDRPLAISSALFETMGQKFSLFQDARRSKITAADASSGMVSDIECLDNAGNIVMAIEVKDRELTVNQIQDKLPAMRSSRVSEIFFLAEKGIAPAEQKQVSNLIGREFSTGQNIYVFSVTDLSHTLLALFGEQGRIQFLRAVGKHLDKYGSSVTHRRRWAELLAQV